MTKPTFSLTHQDPRLIELVGKTDHKILGIWAKECAECVFPYFENDHHRDSRPRQALEVLQAWIDTGVFRMAEIRKASLDSHAAAREVGENNPARSAARAAGQAVATAHVRTHAPVAAIYALQAIHCTTDSSQIEALLTVERDWQWRRLVELNAADGVEPAPPECRTNSFKEIPQRG